MRIVKAEKVTTYIYSYRKEDVIVSIIYVIANISIL